MKQNKKFVTKNSGKNKRYTETFDANKINIPALLSFADYIEELKNRPKVKINKDILDKHLPTGVIATTGDLLPWPFSLSRLRRRAGRAVELANLADADTSTLNTKILHENPLWSDLKHMIGGALIGGGIGAPITTAIQWADSDRDVPFNFKRDYSYIAGPGLVAGGAAGALVGFLVSRIKRNRLIRKLKNLAIEKRSLKTVTKPLPFNNDSWYNENPNFRKGQLQARLLTKLQALDPDDNEDNAHGITSEEFGDAASDFAYNLVSPFPPAAVAAWVDAEENDENTKAIAKYEQDLNGWFDPKEKSIKITSPEIKKSLGINPKQELTFTMK